VTAFDEIPRDWPNRPLGRFVEVPPLRWHVQEGGPASATETVLLLHGTAASTHSLWRLLPRLAERFRVIAPDLPGHGLTTRPRSSDGLSRKGMAASLRDLLAVLPRRPTAVVGHSAGAALGVSLCASGHADRLVGVAPSVGEVARPALPGPVEALLEGVFTSSWTARAAAALARRTGVVGALLESTGSEVPEESARWYRKLISDPSHVGGALAMMARWDLDGAEPAEPAVPTLLLLGARDRWIPEDALRDLVRGWRLRPRIRTVEGAGHLLHEERPALVAEAIAGFLDETVSAD